MRVALITSMFAPSVGGIQSQVRELAVALAGMGADVTVLTRAYPGRLPIEELGSVRVVRVGRTSTLRALATGSALLETWRLLSDLPRFDVLHAHQMLSPMTIALGAHLRSGVPLVVTPHACGDIGDVSELVHRRSFTGKPRLALARRWVSAFVAISEPIRKELLGIGIPANRIHRIPNGVDAARFRPPTGEERTHVRQRLGIGDGPLAVYAGRLSMEKGIDILVAAWRRVRAQVPRASLLVLGEGPLMSDLRGHPGILLHGPVEDTSEFLRAADVFVLPSRTEGLPVALLEAMASGLDAVATRVGGTPEVLREEVDGLLVPAEAPGLLAEGIIRSLSTERPQALARGLKARARILQHFAISTVAQRTAELYEAVVRRAHSRSRETISHGMQRAS